MRPPASRHMCRLEKQLEKRKVGYCIVTSVPSISSAVEMTREFA